MEYSAIGVFVVLCVISIITPTTSISPALILTPYIRQNLTEDARRLSLVNPSLFLNVTSHTGFLTVDEKLQSNTFFWYFPVANKPVNETPWIIWLQGGPGASSLAGLFDEIGPFEFNGQLKLRESSWSKDHSMLFIDNPVGAGYSFTNSKDGYARNMTTYANHLYIAVEQFLTIFPELQTAPLYIAGESYAGRYVPALAENILDKGKLAGNLTAINLQGLIMGNPVFNRNNIANFSNVFYQWGLIDPQQVLAVKPLQDKYIKAVQAGNSSAEADIYFELQSKLKEMAFFNQGFNVLAEKYELEGFETYLITEEIREAMHVGEIKFAFRNYTVQIELTPDFTSEIEPKVVKLLDHYKILIYCGQLDLTAPCVPNAEPRRWRWRWNRRSSFMKAPRLPWWYNETLAGYTKSGGGLTEVLVRGAGHLVPIDKPAQTLQLISYFIRGLDLPIPPNYQPNVNDTLDFAITNDTNVDPATSYNKPDVNDTLAVSKSEISSSKSSSDTTGMIVSVVINVILLLVGVYCYVRWKRKRTAFFYSSVDAMSDDIFLS